MYIALLLNIQYAYANIPTGPGDQPSIASVLNGDGTLKPGVNGSFSAKGFTMMRGKNGQPVFNLRSDKTLEGGWIAGPSRQLAHQVNCIAVAGNTVYAGSNNLYRWDGNKWEIVGGGVNRSVYAIAVHGTDLYVGGDFTSAGGNDQIKSIAKWDGTSWSAMGSREGVVNAIAIVETANGFDIYAGGDRGIGNIIKWNNTTQNWATLPGWNVSSQHTVYALALRGNDLFIGGEFTRAVNNDTKYSGVVKWNTVTNTWGSLIAGITTRVNSLAVSGNDLYIGYYGGIYKSTDGERYTAIVYATGYTYSIAFTDDFMYVGGNFSSVDGKNTMKNGFKMNRSNNERSPINGIALNGPLNAITVSGNQIYLGGRFLPVPGSPYSSIAKGNGSTWEAMGTGIEATAGPSAYGVNEILVNGSDVYVAGWFNSVAGIANTKNIAKWNGTEWQALGAGLNSVVYTMKMLGNDLYVGRLTSIDKWNGNEWSNVGTVANGSAIYALAVIGTDLYVGGLFTTINNVPNTARLAKWDGTAWSAVGNDVISANAVNALAVIGNDLYVGGDFNRIGSMTMNRIGRWNTVSKTWSALAKGAETGVLGGGVYALAVMGTDLYVGGTFTSVVNDKNIQYIAKWNGSTWSALGTVSGDGIGTIVGTLTPVGNDLYVGGRFTTLGNVKANSIIKWSNGRWENFADKGVQMRYTNGSGAPNVSAIVPFGTELLIGGDFSAAGDIVSPYFAVFQTELDPSPVTLLNFIAQAQGHHTKLQWQTAQEINNSGFEIWRKAESNDGGGQNVFVKIGEVPASVSNSTQPITYNFIDKAPQNGINYYKLVQVDVDGKATGLGVKAVSFQFEGHSLKLYPNPAKNQFTITVDIPGEVLVIYDNMGRPVIQQRLTQTQNNINISSLVSGIYFYRYGKEGGRFKKE